jgi:zinc/manganese transport system ATP-binding protein/zinc transport system ATP-binding protein
MRGVSFGYGATQVLDDVSLHLHAGQFAALVGPSGAGKTSLLKLVLGSLRASHGAITVGGQRVDGSPARGVAYVPQVETVDWNFPVTVEQVVLMGRARKSGLWPWPSAEDRRMARAVLDRLEIADLSGRHIRDLSGGQQQRVFLARALISQPQLLVLDEPTSGVDMRTAENVLHLLADLNRAGITILMTTHDLNAAAAHVPWVICLNHTVIAEGPPEEVFTEATLNRTYAGDMVVVRQDGLLLIHQRPHPHTHRDLLPNPVLGHPGGTPAVPPVAPVAGPAGAPVPSAALANLMPPVRPAKEATSDLAA